MKIRLLIVAIVLLWGASLNAQDTIFTDRPTVTFSPTTLPKSWFQVETGFNYQVSDAQLAGNLISGLKLNEVLYNGLLVRFGLTENFELRLNNEISQNRFQLDGKTTFEDAVLYAPTTIGFKWRLLKSNVKWPEISVLGHFGGNVFSDIQTGTVADLALLFKSRLFKSFNLDYNIGLLLEDDLKLATFTYSAVASKQVSQRVGTFAEFFGSRTQEQNPLFSFNFGLTYLLTNTLQVDAYGGTGVNKESPNYFFGFGISKLFLPNK